MHKNIIFTILGESDIDQAGVEWLLFYTFSGAAWDVMLCVTSEVGDHLITCTAGGRLAWPEGEGRGENCEVTETARPRRHSEWRDVTGTRWAGRTWAGRRGRTSGTWRGSGRETSGRGRAGRRPGRGRRRPWRFSPWRPAGPGCRGRGWPAGPRLRTWPGGRVRGGGRAGRGGRLAEVVRGAGGHHPPQLCTSSSSSPSQPPQWGCCCPRQARGLRMEDECERKDRGRASRPGETGGWRCKPRGKGRHPRETRSRGNLWRMDLTRSSAWWSAMKEIKWMRVERAERSDLFSPVGSDRPSRPWRLFLERRRFCISHSPRQSLGHSSLLLSSQDKSWAGTCAWSSGWSEIEKFV